MALGHGVPVFPVVSHGSHNSLIVVSRGDRIGHLIGIDRLRVNVFPFAVGFPFGLTSAFVPYVPIPAKIIVEVLEPIDWSDRGPADADDPDVVRSCYEQITGTMQAALGSPRVRDASTIVQPGARRRGNDEPTSSEGQVITNMNCRTDAFVYRGHRLAYTEYGEGDRVVVYLHGLLIDSVSNRGIAEALARRATAWCCSTCSATAAATSPSMRPSTASTATPTRRSPCSTSWASTNAVLGGMSLGANVSLFAATSSRTGSAA